jgi:all-trans-8'-apo-beta-carotenal 15,15'-oxygenase
MELAMTERTSAVFSRREAVIASAGAAVLSVATTSRLRAAQPAAREAGWLALLGRSEIGGRDCAPRVEGRLPAGLEGSLYRNGPGLFERGGVRKPHLLDGDGLVQRLSFGGGTVRYRNAFVRTPKFQEEEAAGRYLYTTWSQRSPGGMFANLGGGEIRSQAGVTVYPMGAGLCALDEVSPPYTLDPQDLKTSGEGPLRDLSFSIKAHAKQDPVSGEWLLAGLQHGRSMQLHVIVCTAEGSMKTHRVIDSPRQVYVHDFFATEKHIVFLLHPMWFSPWLFLAGLSSYIESLSWKREDGNLVLVVPRDGGETRVFEAPGAFMWHALNAYEQGQTIVADFVGYDAPDHFVGRDALFYALMRGEAGVAQEPGKLRRYVIDLAGGKVREEIVDEGAHEFPMIDPRAATRPHRHGFFSSGPAILSTAIKRLDYATGAQDSFDFGPRTVVGEPVFAARPGGALDEGWLIVQGLDGASGNAFFAVLDASAVGAGPLARVWLDHHLPISFHGWWVPA